MTEDKRLYFIDNMKAVLIWLVVFGHALGLVDFPRKNYVFDLIYLFHMPAFVFISGFCFKPRQGKQILKQMVIPYFCFQTIYLLFSRNILGNPEATLQYSYPYWILWYLMSLFAWKALTMILDLSEVKLCHILLFSIAGLLAGYDKEIGYTLSVSRTIVLYPFFLGGIYVKNPEFIRKIRGGGYEAALLYRCNCGRSIVCPE